MNTKFNLLSALANSRFIFIYVFTLVFSFIIFKYLGIIDLLPSKENLLMWDSGWYNSIRLDGYIYSEQWQSNSGFFPLFPYFWKLTHLNALYISILNGLIGLISVLLIAKAFKFELSETLLCVSLPSFFFMYVPYTESLFFLFSTILLIGLKSDKKNLIAIGLLFASMVRPSTLFFIPSFILVELLVVPVNQTNLFKLLKKVLFYLTFIALGILLVEWLQYATTGVWFAYFKAQSMHWSRTFSIPGFPLTSLDWEGVKFIWIDAIGFLVGLIATVLMLKEIFIWIKNKTAISLVSKKVYLFSLIYLSVTFFSILFFNPKMGDGLTNIIGINRYMLVSPFVMIFLSYHLANTSLKFWQLVLLSILSIFVWFLFGSYGHIQTFIRYGIISTYFIFYFLMLYSIRFKNIWIAIYCLNIILQLWLFNSFLHGQWVG